MMSMCFVVLILVSRAAQVYYSPPEGRQCNQLYSNDSDMYGLDNGLYPANLEILAYQSSDHYQAAPTKYRYGDPFQCHTFYVSTNNSTNKGRVIIWDLYKNQWIISTRNNSKRIANGLSYEYFANCSGSILHECNTWTSNQKPVSGITVIFCVISTISSYANEYVYHGKFYNLTSKKGNIITNYGDKWIFRSLTNDSFIYFDSNELETHKPYET